MTKKQKAKMQFRNMIDSMSIESIELIEKLLDKETQPTTPSDVEEIKTNLKPLFKHLRNEIGLNFNTQSIIDTIENTIYTTLSELQIYKDKIKKITNAVNRGYNQHPSITLDTVIGILYKEEIK